MTSPRREPPEPAHGPPRTHQPHVAPTRGFAQRQFDATPQSVGTARAFVQQACALYAWECPPGLVNAVSELCANSVEHAGGETYAVLVSRHCDSVEVWVTDSSGEPPVIRDLDTSSERGRGMRLVEALAYWCVVRTPTGKTVCLTSKPDPDDPRETTR